MALGIKIRITNKLIYQVKSLLNLFLGLGSINFPTSNFLIDELKYTLRQWLFFKSQNKYILRLGEHQTYLRHAETPKHKYKYIPLQILVWEPSE